MSGSVSRRSGGVQVGPNLWKRRAEMLGIVIGVAFAADVVKFHLLHHLLGAGSVFVVWIALILLAAWGIRKGFRKAFRRR